MIGQMSSYWDLNFQVGLIRKCFKCIKIDSTCLGLANKDADVSQERRNWEAQLFTFSEPLMSFRILLHRHFHPPVDGENYKWRFSKVFGVKVAKYIARLKVEHVFYLYDVFIFVLL